MIKYSYLCMLLVAKSLSKVILSCNFTADFLDEQNLRDERLLLNLL